MISRSRFKMRRCFVLLLFIIIYNVHQDLWQSRVPACGKIQAPGFQRAWQAGRKTIIQADAKGVAGLGKAGGDGQGGSDKAGQQVPPEVYKALTYAGSLFLLTLSVPLILYGLNKLLNKIEDCFGCGPSSAKAKMLAKQNDSSNKINNDGGSHTVQHGQQLPNKQLHANQKLHLQLMHQQPKCYNFTPLNEFDDRQQINQPQQAAHEAQFDQLDQSPLVQPNSFPLSISGDIEPTSSALNSAPGMARKASPNNEPVGTRALPFSQQHQQHQPYIISSPRL